LLLDEPTAGVDPKARREFWDQIHALAAEGLTVLVSTHYMDEAERCHRVALMHAGRLIGLDTIPALKRTFPEGAVVEISCARSARALPVLEGADGVDEVALFGDNLHAVLDSPDDLGAVRRRLENEGFGPVEARPIVPSLEDVFLRSIREAEAEGAPPAAAAGGGAS
jgi:ABC-2 type transport system ATP-binding protein